MVGDDAPDGPGGPVPQRRAPGPRHDADDAEAAAGPAGSRTFLYPEPDGPFPGSEELEAAGVRVVAVPDCGHCIMLDNPEGFARATAEALA